jgi:micrococcal nuclease
MYEYRAKILSVHDGDTVHAQLDLGMDVLINITVRLAHINAPELATPEGRTAHGYLAALLPNGLDGAWVRIQTIKDRTEKYGRYLATIFMQTSDGEINVNERMVETGHAVPYEGGKRSAISNED